jgi:hypothetical protein
VDHAVALVEAYLRVNGYLAVAEYPVLDAPRHGPPQTVTDLDILAIRLATGHESGPGQRRPAVDPTLGAHPDRADMIVGEVKEGAPLGHSVRVVAFGNPHGSPATGPWHTVSLDHVIGYLQEHLRAHWDQIGHSQLKDPTLGLLALLEKSTRASHHAEATR